MDEPYPENLPLVPSCRACNEGASLDEEYVACLLEVAACGSANPTDVRRRKIARTLGTKPALAAQLRTSLQVTGDFVVSGVDAARVSRVVEKIARALWAFEAGEPAGDILGDVQAGQFSYAIESFCVAGRFKMVLGGFLAAEVDLDF